jgi:ATP-dependent RNA helicase DeaD
VLGRIDMKEMNSWVEVDKGAANQMMRSLDGKKYKGRRIRMNEADSVRR